MDLTQSFSTAVRRARTDRGWTQEQAAEAVSISVRWYQRIERGRIPGAVVTLRLVLLYQLSVGQFQEQLNIQSI